MVTKKCELCGKPFTTRYKEQRFCSRSCANSARSTRDLSERSCEQCGKVFKPSRESQRFCSRSCMYESQRFPPQICETCGKEFPYCSQSANRFCSLECANEGQKTGWYKECEVCGKEFWVTPCRADQHTCSHECGWKRRHRLLTCEWCGKTVEVRAHIVESHDGHYSGRFCSYECAAAWQKGENHSNWQGGHDKWRGPNWKRQRNKARKRDNYTCQECGITEDELGRPMDVHHIVPWREFDNDWKKANKLSNLISLCPHCHTTLERNGITPHHNHTNQ